MPEAWDIAFQSLQDNAVGTVKSTNRRPITIKPMESKVITGSVRNCKVKEVLTEQANLSCLAHCMSALELSPLVGITTPTVCQ